MRADSAPVGPSETTRFLTDLGITGSDIIGYRAAAGGRTRTDGLRTPEFVHKLLRSYRDQCDQFVTTSTFKVGAPDRKREHIARVTALSADLDGEKLGTSPRETARRIVHEASGVLGSEPLWVVASGGGWHAHWALNGSGTDVERATVLMGRFGVLMHAVAEGLDVQVDRVWTPERLWRLPGSRNYKREATEGVTEVQLLSTDRDARHLTLDEIEKALDVAGVPDSVITASSAVMTDAVVAPYAEWPTGAAMCPYVARMVAGWESDEPRERNPWMFASLVRLCCAARMGCLGPGDFEASVWMLEARLEALCAQPWRPREVRPLEVRSALVRARERAERKSDAECWGELGGSVHGHAVEGEIYLEAAAALVDETARIVSDETEEMAEPPAVAGGDGGDAAEEFINDARWWHKRYTLAHIHTFARARMVSPAAVLAGVLCRVLCQVPYSMTLPPIVGSKASLNFWCAVVGESGDGKTTADAVAAECITMGTVVTLTPGSGEGLAASFVHRGDPRKKEAEVVQHCWAVHLVVDEVETLNALGGRMGTTLWSELRKSWSGSALGFANRSKETRLPVPSHGYRLTMSVGVQPSKADVILNDVSAGTPQRYLWLPSGDPNAPDEPPDEPPVMSWSPPWGVEVAGASEFEVAEEIAEEIRQIRRDRRKGIGDKMAGHRALTRLKLAAALAVLEGRTNITWGKDSDWELSGDIMDSSDQVRAGVEKVLRAESAARRTSAARAKGLAAVTRDEVVHEAAVKRVCQWLRRTVSKDWVTEGELRRKCASRDRKYLHDGLDRLLSTGDLEESETGNEQGMQYRRMSKS